MDPKIIFCLFGSCGGLSVAVQREFGSTGWVAQIEGIPDINKWFASRLYPQQCRWIIPLIHQRLICSPKNSSFLLGRQKPQGASEVPSALMGFAIPMSRELFIQQDQLAARDVWRFPINFRENDQGGQPKWKSSRGKSSSKFLAIRGQFSIVWTPNSSPKLSLRFTKMAEETKKFCKILLLRPCGLSGYIARVAEDPYPNLWELKSHGYTYHGYTYKTTPKCAPEVLVDRNLCWSQLSTGHLWHFGVGVPHRGGWLKEQGLITSKSNIFSLYIYIICI